MIFDSIPLYDLSEVKLSVRNAWTARRVADCTLACNYQKEQRLQFFTNLLLCHILWSLNVM